MLRAGKTHQQSGIENMDKQHRASLLSVGKQLHASPLSGQERACIVRLSDGTERLGLFQVVNVKQLNDPHRGADFFRVSFRFVGDESQSKFQYNQVQDTVWCVVDHRESAIVFGPEEGLDVREPNIGIGSYLIAQLIRLLIQAGLRGNYQVETIQLPLVAQRKIALEDTSSNDARIEAFLTRAGFFVSPAAGNLVVGARRFQDLRPWWNQEKVRFLQFVPVVEMAAKALRDKQAAEKAVAAAERIVEGARQHAEQLQTEHQVEVKALQARIDQMDGTLAEQRYQHEQELGQLSIDHAQELQAIQDQLLALRRAQPLLIGEQDQAKAPISTGHTMQNMTFGLAEPLMKLLWAGLGLGTFALLVHLLSLLS
ncbi:TPA: hypothetical protein ACP32N_003247 [Pseudomonas aeruginosa]